jgi:hypothetical protein
MKHLEEMHFDLLRQSASKSTRVGRLARGTMNYDMWSVGHETHTESGHSAIAAAAEEASGLSCLFPRKSKKGKLYLGASASVSMYWEHIRADSVYLVSKSISRHLVVASQATALVPPPLDDQAPPPESLYQNPPRPSYSEDVLTHKFMPYGTLIDTSAQATTVRVQDVTMDVDEDSAPPAAPAKKLKGKKALSESTPVDVPEISDKKQNLKVGDSGKDKNGKKRKPERKEETNSKQAKKPKLGASS